MKKGALNRDQAIERAGQEIVDLLDYENAEYSNRVMPECLGVVEFIASLKFVDTEGEERTLTAYYYQDRDDVTDEEKELDSLDWEIEGYEIW